MNSPHYAGRIHADNMPHTADSAVPRALRPARVLVVEDDQALRTLFERSLEDSGYFVTVASTGTEAIAVLQEEPFDAVVLDLVLPWVNGYQVLAAMRDQTPNSAAPVIVITGAAVTDWEFKQDPRVTLLRKPFDTDLLVKAVHVSLYDAGKKIG